jgi:sirohydrochlorin ferrochelatase
MQEKRKAILYICHGSRVGKAREQAVSFVQQLMEKKLAPVQEIAFLELADPSVSEAFQRCVDQGASTIVAIPILLLTAAHAKEDIPLELEKQQSRFPHVEIKYGHPIGVNEKMIDLLLERIAEPSIPIQEEAIALIVGRGSSDPDVKRDLLTIGEALQKRSRFKRVEVCFLAGSAPNLDEGLQSVAISGAEQVFVIPYLFFTGILLNKINKTIKNFDTDRNVEWILCQSLGYHPIIEEIFHDQIKTLLPHE